MEILLKKLVNLLVIFLSDGFELVLLSHKLILQPVNLVMGKFELH